MKRMIILFILICINSYGIVFEDSTGNAKLKYGSSVELVVNGNKAYGRVYYSKNTSSELINLCREALVKDGFVSEYVNPIGKETVSASFKKGKSSVTVQVYGENGLNTVTVYETEEKPGVKQGEEPGKDLEDAPRPLLSKRKFYMERLSGKERSVTVIYNSGSSVSSLENFYRQAMKKNGWDNIVQKESGQMIFTKLSKLCVLSFSGDCVTLQYFYKTEAK